VKFDMSKTFTIT